MIFQEYCEQVERYGYFSVELGDNRVQPAIADGACDFVTDKWLTPLIAVAERAYLYRRVSKTAPYDATPPPRGSRPVLARRSTRVELDTRAVLLSEHRRYLHWALRHANMVLVVPTAHVPTEAIATESWDPGILTNLEAVAARGAKEFARCEIAKRKACFLFSRDSYTISCHIFAPPKELLRFYECFVLNCRFVLKGLEQELAPMRRKKR